MDTGITQNISVLWVVHSYAPCCNSSNSVSPESRSCTRKNLFHASFELGLKHNVFPTFRRHLRQRGLLFLMLPRKCIARVTGIPCHCFERMLNDVGFLLIEKKLSPKVAFFLYQVDELPPQPLGVAGTEGKSICNGNTKQERWERRRSNAFSIVL